MTVLFAMYVMSGVALIGLSIPLIRRRVPPNPLYGFRVGKTLSDPEVWYDANAYAARGLLWVGIATIAAALLIRAIPNIGVDGYAIGVSVFALGGLVINVIASFRYLHGRTS